MSQKVLLLDEPLGALDLKAPPEMQYELIRLKNESSASPLSSLRDQEEALTMSDTIVVMNQGYIQQIGTPEMIYNEPVNAFVADFIGDSNIIDGIMVKDRVVEILGTRIPCVWMKDSAPTRRSTSSSVRRMWRSLHPGKALWTAISLPSSSRASTTRSRSWRAALVAGGHHAVLHRRNPCRDPRDSIQHPDYEQTGIRGRGGSRNRCLTSKNSFWQDPYLIWMIGFILLPLVFILYYAITAADGSFTFSNIAAIADPVHVKSILLSLKLGFLCTLVCLVLSYPLCMILSTFRFRHQSFVVFLFILPMWMNFMLRILAWRLLLSNNGIVNAILEAVGTGHVKMLNTPTAVVFGMVYDFLPFMILPIYNSMVRINKDVIEAARDLGANNLTVLVKIIFPLTLSGVLSGIVMVFVPALTSFVISDLLGGGKVLLIGNVIEQEFMQGTNWHLGSGLSVVLMLFVIASMALMNVLDKDEGGTAVW